MDPAEVFPMPPFAGEFETAGSPEVFETLETTFEDEAEFGRRGGGMRRAPPRRRPPPRAARPPRPRHLHLPPTWPPYGGAYAFPPGVEPLATAEPGSARWRCVQACMTGTPGAAQAEPAAPANDAPDSLAGPDTGADAPPESEFEFEAPGAATPDCTIIDLTAKSDRSRRKGTRDPASVYALVLHQMACCARRRDPLRSYLRINAHFAILPEGQILQLHPVSALLWTSHGFNSKSVGVEFAGNFPNVQGKWWKGETYGRDRPTPAQLEAGRCLVRHLIRTMGLRVVLAHRQSSNMRGNDPGPEVWYHVGQWAVDTLGLSDGGPGFKIGTGQPILDAWRTWGRSGGSTPELEAESAGEYAYESQGEVAPGLLTLDAAIADRRAAGPGIYTLYKNGARVYAGRSDNVRRRLQQHRWCLTHLTLDAGRFHVKLTPLPGAPPAHLGRVEAAVIDRFGRRSQGGQLANVKARELEQELPGEAWP